MTTRSSPDRAGRASDEDARPFRAGSHPSRRAVIAGTLAAALAPASGARAATVRWRLVSALEADDPAGPDLTWLAKELKRDPAAMIEIDDPAAAERTSVRAALEELRAGKTQLAAVPVSGLLPLSSLYGLDRIPFLARSQGEITRLAGFWRPYLGRRLREEGYVLIALLRGADEHLVVEGPAPVGKPQRMAAATAAERRFAELIGAQTSATIEPGVAAIRPEHKIGAGETILAVEARFTAVAVIARKSTVDALGQPLGASLGATIVAAERRSFARAGDGPAGPPGAIDPALAAAGRQMAHEWVTATGADGRSVLAALTQ